MSTDTTYTAFAGSDRIASGPIASVALRVKEAVDDGEDRCVLVFDDATSLPLELDLRGTAEDVRRRLPAEEAGVREAGDGTPGAAGRRGPGRPRLGVVGREVTLLPRHWEWLASQPGGASVTLRKLVEKARRESSGADRERAAQESAYRFMSAMAGNEPGFEEATRALFAGDAARFEEHSAAWPPDVREHARTLASRVFAEGGRGG